ncbi:MAG: sulfatase [Acidobacteriota bacterium]
MLSAPLRRGAKAPRHHGVKALCAIAALSLAVLGCQPSAPATDSADGEAGSPAAAASLDARQHNVLLISADTVRADRLNIYGYDERELTPNLDRLLSRGVLFEQATAPRTITWPSLATVLTGLYPSGHGVIENGYELPPDLETLPKRLRAEGYQTAAFLSNMCRAGHDGWDVLRCSHGRDGRTVQWSLEWAQQIDPERPWLIWIHLFGAHGPYYNGGDLARTRFDPDYTGDLIPKKWRLDAVMKEQQELSPADIRHLDAIYDAAVAGTDGLVGRILDGLGFSAEGSTVAGAPREGAPVGDRGTTIVFLSDHGEDLYDHNGYLYHACSVYETSLHVPLGIVAEGVVPTGSRINQPVELSDVTPTILDLMSLESQANFHGDSLVPYLRRSDHGGRGKPAFSEYGSTRIHTVRSGPWKLVDNPDGLTPYCFAGGPKDLYPVQQVELYNLEQDPLEQENVADQHQARVAEMRELIRNRFSSLQTRDQAQDIPEDLKEELRSLGYVAN